MKSYRPEFKFDKVTRSPSFPRRVALLVVLVSFILAFLLGSELLARQGGVSPREPDYRPTPFHPSDCSICHLASAEGVSRELKAPIPQLCMGCHPEVAGSMNSGYKHEIFAGGKCLLCHSIHSPAAGRLLKADAQTLCGGCHKEAAELVASSIHAGLSGVCITCHAGHSSAVSGILKNDPVSLCSSCHDLGDQKRNHPVGEEVTDPLTGGALTCTSSCHHPHGSVNEMQLRQANSDGLCLSCHDMSVI